MDVDSNALLEPTTAAKNAGVDIVITRNVLTCPLLVSQYAWLLCIVVPVALAFAFPRFHPAKVYTSQKSAKWNASSDPFLFLHATDIHLSSAEPLKIVNTRALVHSMNFYRPNFTLISGDMVDNYGKLHWPKIGRQIIDDWNMWRRVVEQEAKDMDIVDLAGNHDMWALDFPLSKEHYFMDYSYTFNRTNTKTDDEFYVKTIEFRGFKFVLVNPYRFPSAHPPYTYWCHPSQHMLDVIEDAVVNAGTCYVVCHYPVDDVWGVKSSKGHTFAEIMQSENIVAYFSGHWHPKVHTVIHHGQGAVEYIGPGAFQFKAFGAVTLDNGRMVYHTISLLDAPTRFLLTHPIPIDELSSHQVFNERETEIRLISYAGRPVTIMCDGSVRGILKFQRKLQNGADLYSLPCKLEEGLHYIELYGDGCNIQRTFFIGEAVLGQREVYILCHRGFHVARASSVFVFLFLLWMILPGKWMRDTETEAWIEGENGRSRWWYAIVFGPNVIRARFANVPQQMRYVVLAALLYPVFMPLHFFKPICGMFGFSWLCFVVIGGHVLFDEWALHMSFFYIMVLMLPYIMTLSCWHLRKKSRVFHVNFFVAILLQMGLCVINYRWVGESVTVINLFLNPSFVLVPLLLHYSYFKYCLKETNRKYSESHSPENVEHVDVDNIVAKNTIEPL